MTRHAPSTGRGNDDERGSVAVFAIVVVFAIIAVLGLVVDGGGQLRASDKAQHAAEQAARAAGQELNAPDAQDSGTFTTNRSSAVQAAQQYLAAAGVDGGVSISGNTVTVTTTTTYKRQFLGGTATEHGTATANLEHGITNKGDS